MWRPRPSALRPLRSRYRDEIIALEGFGEKSYGNLIASINESRNTTFVRFVVAMDIPLICSEKAGSKLAKAQQLGVKILTEQEFLEMLSA